MHHTYHGSCHCGRVGFELDTSIDHVVECNCSLCRRRGVLWHAVSDSGLRILSDMDDLVLYQFGTMTAKHYFCRHCGVAPFARPRIDPSLWVVNARCIDGLDLSALKVQLFDGEHWEQAAAALLASRRRQPMEPTQRWPAAS